MVRKEPTQLINTQDDEEGYMYNSMAPYDEIRLLIRLPEVADRKQSDVALRLYIPEKRFQRLLAT